MRKHVLILWALLISCGAASAQPRPDPDDGYWGPREPTFEQRWASIIAPILTEREPDLETTGYASKKIGAERIGADMEIVCLTALPPLDQ